MTKGGKNIVHVYQLDQPESNTSHVHPDKTQ